jgi:hypothetical protein
MSTAVRTGAHKPTLALLFVAHLAYVILRWIGLAELNRRVRAYAPQRGRPEPGKQREPRLVCAAIDTSFTSQPRGPR